MIRRLLLVAAAAAASVTASAIPVQADGPADSATLEDAATAFVERTANTVLQNVPSPGGWQERHVCAWSEQVDMSICVYFPWPI